MHCARGRRDLSPVGTCGTRIPARGGEKHLVTRDPRPCLPTHSGRGRRYVFDTEPKLRHIGACWSRPAGAGTVKPARELFKFIRPSRSRRASVGSCGCGAMRDCDEFSSSTIEDAAAGQGWPAPARASVAAVFDQSRLGRPREQGIHAPAGGMEDGPFSVFDGPAGPDQSAGTGRVGGTSTSDHPLCRC